MAPRERYLLLDDRVVHQTDNARLAVGQVTKHQRNPLFCEDLPWELRFDNLYPNVIHDAEEGLYRCWYSPFTSDVVASTTPEEQYPSVKHRQGEREMGVCYAESSDGLSWEMPPLGLV